MLVKVGDRATKLLLKYTSYQWTKIYESGNLHQLDGLNKMPPEVLEYVLSFLLPDRKHYAFSYNREYFSSLQKVNSAFREIVLRILARTENRSCTITHNALV